MNCQRKKQQLMILAGKKLCALEQLPYNSVKSDCKSDCAHKAFKCAHETQEPGQDTKSFDKKAAKLEKGRRLFEKLRAAKHKKPESSSGADPSPEEFYKDSGFSTVSSGSCSGLSRVSSGSANVSGSNESVKSGSGSESTYSDWEIRNEFKSPVQVPWGGNCGDAAAAANQMTRAPDAPDVVSVLTGAAKLFLFQHIAPEVTTLATHIEKVSKEGAMFYCENGLAFGSEQSSPQLKVPKLWAPGATPRESLEDEVQVSPDSFEDKDQVSQVHEDQASSPGEPACVKQEIVPIGVFSKRNRFSNFPQPILVTPQATKAALAAVSAAKHLLNNWHYSPNGKDNFKDTIHDENIAQKIGGRVLEAEQPLAFACSPYSSEKSGTIDLFAVGYGRGESDGSGGEGRERHEKGADTEAGKAGADTEGELEEGLRKGPDKGVETELNKDAVDSVFAKDKHAHGVQWRLPEVIRRAVMELELVEQQEALLQEQVGGVLGLLDEREAHAARLQAELVSQIATHAQERRELQSSWQQQVACCLFKRKCCIRP